MARKKSNFYHIRWNRVRLNEQRAAEILGVSVEDVRRWDIEGAPVMAERLLLLWDSKEVNIDGWAGFRFVRGILTNGRRRWRPENLIQWRDQAEEIEALKNELHKLKTWRGLSTGFVDKLGDTIRRHQRRRAS